MRTNEIPNMYMKSPFPIHENVDVYTKTPKRIHVNHHIDINEGTDKTYERVERI